MSPPVFGSYCICTDAPLSRIEARLSARHAYEKSLIAPGREAAASVREAAEKQAVMLGGIRY